MEFSWGMLAAWLVFLVLVGWNIALLCVSIGERNELRRQLALREQLKSRTRREGE